MDISTKTARRISIAAWAMAAFGTVAGQLHALARFNSHPEDLESGLGGVWAEPAIDAMRPLLEWANPYDVYLTYGKLWFPVALAFTAAAFLVYRRQAPRGVQKRVWQVQLAAYALMTLSVFGDYYTPWIELFFGVGLVAFAVIGLGGPVLGISLLRSGFRPRTTAWCLIVFLPFFFAITEVTSMGSALLPLMWGWALAAHRVVRTERVAQTPERAREGAFT